MNTDKLRSLIAHAERKATETPARAHMYERLAAGHRAKLAELEAAK